MSIQPPPRSDEFGKCEAAFLAHCQHRLGLSVNTVKSYGYDISTFLKYLKNQGVSDLARIDEIVTEVFLEASANEGFSKQTVNRRLGGIRKFARYLLRQRIVPRDFTQGIRGMKMVRHLPTVLTQAEARSLLASPNPGDDPMFLRDKTMLELLYGSGMRALEVVGLRVGSLGPHNDSVKITGKGEQDRIVPISKSTATAATEYQRFLRPSLVHQGRPVPNLFLSCHGRAMCERSLWRTVRRYAKRVELTIPVHPHTLRHSCATHMVENGADLESVRQILGHKDIATTAIYIHTSAAFVESTYRRCHPLEVNGAAEEPGR